MDQNLHLSSGGSSEPQWRSPIDPVVINSSTKRVVATKDVLQQKQQTTRSDNSSICVALAQNQPRKHHIEPSSDTSSATPVTKQPSESPIRLLATDLDNLKIVDDPPSPKSTDLKMHSSASHETQWSLFEDISSDSSDRPPISGDGTLIPTLLHGIPSENLQEWIQYFKTFSRYKRHKQSEALELFKVLSRGSMATWIATLDPATSSDPKTFSKAFQTKYLNCPSRQVRLGKYLFSRRQGPIESVDDYFVAIQSLVHRHQLNITTLDFMVRA